ncbi:MAG: pyrroloquinoline quinone biosynthesis peptide chaperone PqqD [Gammaproteobacteria bacterium]|nr:pyrroloquinoline quinone biosynthesis peptide chaperone PqqD [Gammaproteobacteria bacterium]
MTLNTVIKITPTFRLQWEPAQNAHVLLYPEGMVKLNPSAGEILKHCDGARKVSQLVAELQTQFPGADLEADVLKFLRVAHEQGWIKSV